MPDDVRELPAATTDNLSRFLGGTPLSGGVGYVFGTLFGVLIQGLIQVVITFDGTLNSWWTRIIVGMLTLFFIVLQRFLSGKSQRQAAA